MFQQVLNKSFEKFQRVSASFNKLTIATTTAEAVVLVPALASAGGGGDIERG